MGITAAVVIGLQHVCGIGLAEAPRTAYAGKPVFPIDRLVDYRDQSAFINIIIIPYFLEVPVSRIDIKTHALNLPDTSLIVL